MRRHKSGVSFHHPSQVVNETAQDTDPIADITDHDPKVTEDLGFTNYNFDVPWLETQETNRM